MASEDRENGDRKTMQESWVEVKSQQPEGALAHSHSLEMEELLASAVAEKEQGGVSPPSEARSGSFKSTSPTMFEVRFEPAEEEPTDEELAEEQKQSLQLQSPPTQPLIIEEHPKASTPPPRRSRRRVLFLLVPVLLLTHLAVFGIGYYLGRWFSVETVVTVFHV